MAEISGAKCSVCGTEFTGPDCIEKAEAHEKIPVDEPRFVIGEAILTIYDSGLMRVIYVETITISTRHRHLYNGFDLEKHQGFSLHLDNDGVLKREDIMNSPEHQHLRDIVVGKAIDRIFKEAKDLSVPITVQE